MKRVFLVTINYGGSINEIPVIARDDVEARKAAIEDDRKDFEDENLKAPRIEFCEVKFVCEAIVA